MSPLEPRHIACSNSEVVRKLWTRFRHSEILNIADRWRVEVPAAARLRKAEVVDYLVLQRFQNGLSHRQIADLDFAYILSRRYSKHWHAAKFTECIGALDTDPVALEYEFSRKLDVFVKHFTSVRMISDCLWIRCSVWDDVSHDVSMTSVPAVVAGNATRLFSRLPGASSTVFLVHRSGCPFVLYTQAKRELLQFVFQAMSLAFSPGGAGVEKLGCSGRDAYALLDSLQRADGAWLQSKISDEVDGKHSHSPRVGSGFALHSSAVSDVGPAVLGRKRARAAATNVDIGRRVRQRYEFAESFGQSTIPTMERVTFVVRGEAPAGFPESNPSFRMTVLFGGRNVLQGICSLVAEGMLASPLPDSVHSLLNNPRAVVDVPRPP